MKARKEALLANEVARLSALSGYRILDSPPEESFDAITRIAAHICGAPIALIAFVDEQRQWFKSKVGLTIKQSPREGGFWTYAIQNSNVTIITDASADERFATHPMVVNRPHIRFYAGVPLITAAGHALGTLCVLDRVARQINSEQLKTLHALANEVMIQLELRRKNLELEPMRDRLELILDAAGVGVYGIDNDGLVTFTNPAAARMLGYEIHELMGKPIHALIHHSHEDGTSYPMSECPVYATLTGGAIHEIDDEVFWRKDGTSFYVKYTSTPLLRGNEQLGAVVTFQNISEQKKTQELLRKSEQHYRLITETATDAIITIDADSHVLFANHAVERIFGYTVAEVQGQNLTMLMPAFMRHQHENSLKHYLSSEERHPTLDGIELTGLHRDGHEVPLNVSFRESTHGGTSHFTGIIRDATERKRHETALRNSEERYRCLYDQNPSIYFTVDIHGITLSVNEFGASRLGYRVDELVGRRGLMVVHEDDHALAHEQFVACVNNRSRVAHLEVRMRRRDGTVFWVKETVRLVHGVDDQPVVLIVCQDITDRKMVQDALELQTQELQRSKAAQEKQTRILQSILDSMGDGVIVADEEGKLLFINPAAEKIIGLNSAEVAPDETVEQFCTYLPAILTPGSENDIPLVRAIRGEEFDAAEVLIRHAKTPKPAWLSVTGRPLKDSDGVARGGVVVFHDSTEQKQAEQRLNHLANYDALTGLPNRTLFFDRLGQSLARAHWQERLLAVLFIDLDRFKGVNDMFGHSLGDLLLLAVAERLTDCVRAGDTVARLGGDEFALILAEVATEDDVFRVVQKIQDTLRVPFRIEKHDIFITSSIGISMFPSDGDCPDLLLKNADTAMYRAKDEGKNQYRHYSSIMGAQATQRVTLENALRHALEREELQLYYQPLIETATGRIICMEALLRWQRSKEIMILPATFISIAEDSGLIVPIGEWVLRTACRQNKAWQNAGFAPVRMAVNLSARQFQQQDMLEIVTHILEETGLDAHYLELELTESIMQNAEAVGTLRSLRETGLRIVIDDFGTGYSSLNYLKHFPIDKLKVDQSFVAGIPDDPDNTAITTAIIAMAHSLKLKVVAEGVETLEQLVFLKSLGCDEMQGYYLSKPLPAHQVVELL